MRCPTCNGEGGWPDDRGIDGYEDWDDCGRCEQGSVSIWNILSQWFWERVPVSFLEWYGDKIR